MQRFDDEQGKRRLLNIENMKVRDVKDYYSQFPDLENDKRVEKMKKLKDKIKSKISYEWYLAIKTKEGKIIGKIEVFFMKPDIAFVTIAIPNESKSRKYGEEAIDQFVKICREKKYSSTVELDRDNPIIERYIHSHDNIKDYKIEVA